MTPERALGDASLEAEATRAELAHAAQALEHVSDGVILVDVCWRITFANSTASALVGRTVEELVGHDFWDVFPDAVAHEFGERYREAMRTQEPQHLEAYYGPLQGWFDVRATPSPTGLTLTFQNVDERRAALADHEALVGRLEEALSRQNQTQSVVMTLADALSVEDVAASVLQLANWTLGTAVAGVALLSEDGESLRFVTLDSLPSAAVAEWGTLAMDVSSGLTDCVRLRRPMYNSSRGELLATYPNLAATVEEAGTHAFASVPLLVGGRVIGALSMSWRTERVFTEQDRAFLRMLAAQCAQAVERTQLIGRQRDVAETLQQAMLPDDLPTVEGTEVSACYLPTRTGMAVGGDWYDGFTLGDGRLVFAVGDVSGHGVQAAAVMGQVRNALRAYIVEGHDPAGALANLDELVDHAGHGLFATAIVASYRPATGELVWSNAGHPPLVLRTPSGSRFLEGHVAAPVGVRGPVRHVNDRIVLEKGDTLIAYTDGLIERRNEDLADGLSRLITAVDVVADRVVGGGWCEELVDLVLGDVLREDDICLLVLQRG
jgi:serine phosphatase RsbU (regulator of sigma subunit)